MGYDTICALILSIGGSVAFICIGVGLIIASIKGNL